MKICVLSTVHCWVVTIHWSWDVSSLVMIPGPAPVQCHSVRDGARSSDQTLALGAEEQRDCHPREYWESQGNGFCYEPNDRLCMIWWPLRRQTTWLTKWKKSPLNSNNIKRNWSRRRTWRSVSWSRTRTGKSPASFRREEGVWQVGRGNRWRLVARQRQDSNKQTWVIV